MADRRTQRPQGSSNDRAKRFKPHHGQHQHRGPNRGNPDDFVPETYLAKVRTIGNTPEDIARWREERRKRFPRSSDNVVPEQPVVAKVNALSAHFAAYASEDEEEEEIAHARKEQQEHTMGAQAEKIPLLDSSAPRRTAENEAASSESLDREPQARQCTHFARFGRCKFGARCRFAHEKPSGEPEDSREEEEAGNAGTSATSASAKHSKGSSTAPGGIVSNEMLLRKLLQDEIDRENAMLLECIYYVVARNFFEPEVGNQQNVN